MTKTAKLPKDTTVEWLLENIERFFDTNPDISDESFGWCACKDSSLVPRLRLGRDMTTSKMDAILAFLTDPVATKRSGLMLKPIKIKRRTYG